MKKVNEKFFFDFISLKCKVVNYLKFFRLVLLLYDTLKREVNVKKINEKFIFDFIGLKCKVINYLKF